MADAKLALVVSANKGIGLGVVKAFLARGWSVIATARRPDAAGELRAVAAAHPGRVEIAALDITDTAGLDAFAASLRGRVLDAALFNTGVAGPAHRSASAVTEVELGALMFVNAVGPVRLARALAGTMRRDTGVMAFTSSVMGSIALSTGGHELYRASKAALNALCRGLWWSELRGRGVSAVSLHPGWVRTDMGGAGAPVSVAESAAGIVAVIEREAGGQRHRFVDYTGKELAW